MYRKQFSPRFHETEVANLSQKDKKDVVDSLDKLTGLLAVTYIQDDFSPRRGSYVVYFAKRRWFLPTARIPDAEKILSL